MDVQIYEVYGIEGRNWEMSMHQLDVMAYICD
jgi:hypothetical protein